MLQKRKKINKALITLMFLALLIIGTYFISNRYKKESIYKDNIKVINTLTQVLDISTVKYNYSNIVEIKKDKSISNIKIPFTEKSFIVKYNGVINGGVKPEDIEIVSNTGDEIIIEIKTKKSKLAATLLLPANKAAHKASIRVTTIIILPTLFIFFHEKKYIHIGSAN